MKQQKLSDYQPNYPKKAVKGMTLAAAALLTIGAATGCRLIRPETTGIVPMEEPGVEQTLPPEELQTEGMVPIDEMETPEPPMTTGVIMGTPEPEKIEEPMLMGDVAVLEP